MTEELITFKTAKLAKEKGFPMYYSSPNRVYDNGSVKNNAFSNYAHSDHPGRFFPAPTQNLLQKWLRENHHIDISIITNYSHYKNGDLTGNKTYRTGIIYIENKLIESFFIRPIKDRFNFVEYKTYEEALEFGLIEGLKLIKNEK